MSINHKDIAREAKAHRLYKATKPTNLTPPITYGNAMTKGPLKAICMASPRADANDNLQYASHRVGAQINRVSQKQKPQVAQTA